jgi:hypothetical protein
VLIYRSFAISFNAQQTAIMIFPCSSSLYSLTYWLGSQRIAIQIRQVVVS